MSRDVVLLDAGGTLFEERETRDETYSRLLAAQGLDVGVEATAALRKKVHDAMLAEAPAQTPYTTAWFREFVRRLLAELGSRADPEPVRRQLAEHFARPEHFVVHADAHPALEELTTRGVRLGVVSNWSDQLPALLQALDLWEPFEVVAVSAVVGHTKPDAALFHWALERMGARPGQALHVGDHAVNDVAGARRAGLAAVLLDRSASVDAPGVISSLAEIPAHLAG